MLTIREQIIKINNTIHKCTGIIVPVYFNQDYRVCEHGFVYGLTTTLNYMIHKNRFVRVFIRGISLYVNRIVLISFYPRLEKDVNIIYLDHNTLNNHIDNLKAVTLTELLAHRRERV